MDHKEAVDLIERVLHGWTTDQSTLPSVYAKDAFVEHVGGGKVHGPGEIGERGKAFVSAFTGIKGETTREVLVEGNKIAWHWKITGTNTRPFRGVQPSGKEVVLEGVDIITVGPDGLITSEYGYWDSTPLWVAVGLLDNPPLL